MKTSNYTLPLLCSAIILMTLTTPPPNGRPRFGVRIGTTSSTLHFTSRTVDEAMEQNLNALWAFSGVSS